MQCFTANTSYTHGIKLSTTPIIQDFQNKYSTVQNVQLNKIK